MTRLTQIKTATEYVVSFRQIMWCVADNGSVQPQDVAEYSDPAGQTWIGVVLSIQVSLNFTVGFGGVVQVEC